MHLLDLLHRWSSQGLLTSDSGPSWLLSGWKDKNGKSPTDSMVPAGQIEIQAVKAAGEWSHS